jgi:hypothetical protein
VTYTIGDLADTESVAGNGSVIAILKRLRTLLTGGPATAHATGQATALGANVVLADSGAMAADNYEVIVHVGSSATAGVGQYLLVEHRNAANTATLHRHVVPAPGEGIWRIPKMALAATERIRVVGGPTAGTAASLQTADIYLRAVA